MEKIYMLLNIKSNIKALYRKILKVTKDRIYQIFLNIECVQKWYYILLNMEHTIYQSSIKANDFPVQNAQVWI